MVTFASIVSTALTFYLLIARAELDVSGALHLLGWWPVHPTDTAACVLLTWMLYLGPHFEKIVVEKQLQGFREKTVESLYSWQGYRTYIAAPITEEVIFRSVLVPIHLLAKVSPGKIVFLTPLYFGIAHIHHAYEFKLTRPDVPFFPVLIRSLFQFGYTTIFGWYASFLYLRTGSLYGCILVHTFCNLYGLPRFWGRVEREEHYVRNPVILRGKDDVDAVAPHGEGGKLELGWTVAYYVLLVTGVYAFYVWMWPLTRSDHGLAAFARDKNTLR